MSRYSRDLSHHDQRIRARWLARIDPIIKNTSLSKKGGGFLLFLLRDKSGLKPERLSDPVQHVQCRVPPARLQGDHP